MTIASASGQAEELHSVAQACRLQWPMQPAQSRLARMLEPCTATASQHDAERLNSGATRGFIRGVPCNDGLDGYPLQSPAQLENDMAPHQERVVTEKAELDEKLTKLKAFFETDLFKNLDEDEQERMWRQADHMGDYSSVLGERIAAF